MNYLLSDYTYPRRRTDIAPTTTGRSAPPTYGPTGIHTVRPGMYVAFALDPAALVGRSLHANNDLLATFPTQKFVGVVKDATIIQSGNNRVLDVMVMFVSGTLPPSSTFLGLDRVLIAPATRNVSPYDGMAPLETGEPFPWEGVFQWTSLGVKLRITHFYSSTRHFALDHAIWRQLETRIIEPDVESMERLRECGRLVDVDPVLTLGATLLPARMWTDISLVDDIRNPAAFAVEVNDVVA